MFSVVMYPCFISLPIPYSFKLLNFVHQCVLHFNFFLFGDLGRLVPLNLLMCSGVIRILFHVKCLFKYFAQFKMVIYLFIKNVQKICKYSEYEPCIGYVLVAQACPTPCKPLNCSLLGISVYGILETRILESVVIPISKGSS